MIALLTDFGLEDPYVGVMKGVINSINPIAKMLDITHSVRRHDICQASFMLGRTFMYFPEGTIFVVVVDPGVGSDRKALAAHIENYYFIAPDNGVIAPFLENLEVKSLVEIKNPACMLKTYTNTFQGRDIFAPAAACLSGGIPILEMGPEVAEWKKLDFPEVINRKDFLIGSVIFEDRFGDLITNIDMSFLNGRTLKSIIIDQTELNRINNSYDESPEGELLAIAGSYGTIEIAVNKGSAKDILNAKQGFPVEIRFWSHI